MSLEFTEYRAADARFGAMPQLVEGEELATQTVTIGATVQRSAAFQNATNVIVITNVSADCRIKIGPGNPVAVTTGVGQTRKLYAGNEYAFFVKRGHKLAVIQA